VHQQRTNVKPIRSRAEAEDSKYRQHPDRIDEVGQCFGGVIDLHHPAR